MSKIDDLKAIDTDKIKNEKFVEIIDELIEDYEGDADKEGFLKAEDENIKTVFELVDITFPEGMTMEDLEPSMEEKIETLKTAFKEIKSE